MCLTCDHDERFWTHGYDIYAPTKNVVAHEYVRAHGSKFWETVGLVFSRDGFHNGLVDVVVARMQHLLQFPSKADATKVKPSFILKSMMDYNQGSVRSLEDFEKLVGLDIKKLTQTPGAWCGHATEAPTRL